MSASRQKHILALLEEALPIEVLLKRLKHRLDHEGERQVEKRSLQMDIRRLTRLRLIERVTRRELEVPAVLDGYRSFYRRIPGQDLIPLGDDHQLHWLTEDEVLALEVARGLLAAPRRKPGETQVEDPLAEAIEALLNRLGVDKRVRNQARLLVTAQTFSKERYRPTHLADILRALRLKNGLQIDYEPLGRPAHPALVQPVRLVLVDNEWYLFAWERVTRMLKTYKLSRVRSAVVVAQLRDAPAMLDAQVEQALLDHFRSTSNQQRTRVVARFSPQAWPHIRDRLWGANQQPPDVLADGWHRLVFSTGGIDGVRWWLLGFGAEVVAEQPAELVAWIRDQITRSAGAYPG